jgi:hypothetical protein
MTAVMPQTAAIVARHGSLAALLGSGGYLGGLRTVGRYHSLYHASN